jgi:5-formyltetrahydrofolate cyclo-ligase
MNKTKSELRLEAKSVLEKLKIDGSLEMAAEKAVLKIAQLEVFKAAQKILLYEPLLDELNLNQLKENYKNKEYLIPQYAQSKAFPSEAFIEICRSVDLVIVPALAYDKFGYRLGRGGGYYDRLFAKLRKDTSSPFFLGVISKELILDELFHEEHDMSVDCLLSV